MLGANTNARPLGFDERQARSNYLIGNDPKLWQTDVPSYAKVKYQNIYQDVDMVFYGNQRQLEYDFIIGPKADYQRIRLQFTGQEKLRIDTNGDLVLTTAAGDIRQHKPTAYQDSGTARKEITARYKLRGSHVVGFALGNYDVNRPVVIDPVLSYSTYLGGSLDDASYSIAVDASGNAYITGETYSIPAPLIHPSKAFPTTRRAFQRTVSDLDISTAFVVKMNATGTDLIYSTYLGGQHQDRGLAIRIDPGGNAYVCGTTNSSNFPVTSGAFQTTLAPAAPGMGGLPHDVFVSKLNATGSALLFSTFIGGNGEDMPSAMAVDPSGNSYVTGDTDSLNFPTRGQFNWKPTQQVSSGFTLKLNASGSDVTYSTYLEGHSGGRAIAVDDQGNAYVAGSTFSRQFPVSPGAFQTVLHGNSDGFVMKLDQTGTVLLYSTYLGGRGYDPAFGIAVDPQGNAYIAGQTNSDDFPITDGAFQAKYGGGFSYGDAYVAKLNPTGTSLIYSSYFGGSEEDSGYGIAIDSDDNAYVTGWTGSRDLFVTFDAFQREAASTQDAFLVKINQLGTTILYSTYLGGTGGDIGNDLVIDESKNAYMTGIASREFPTSRNAFQREFVIDLDSQFRGGDAFIAKIDMAARGPMITGASISGKRLLVTGSEFDDGAVLMLNGENQKTQNDQVNPTTTLVCKKAGKKIPAGALVTLQVRNSNGGLSPDFVFTRP